MSDKKDSSCNNLNGGQCGSEEYYDARIVSSTNFNAQFSLFINNMFVTLLSSTCFEH